LKVLNHGGTVMLLDIVQSGLVLGQEQNFPAGGFELNKCFAGDIGRFMIFNRALNPYEVQILYQQAMSVPELPASRISVAPNPSDGHFKIYLPSQKISGILITNCTGQTVWHEYSAKGWQSTISIDCSELPSGLFNLQILEGGFIWREPIVIVK